MAGKTAVEIVFCHTGFKGIVAQVAQFFLVWIGAVRLYIKLYKPAAKALGKFFYKGGVGIGFRAPGMMMYMNGGKGDVPWFR